ncbi:MAG: hypothetical protein Q9190_001822 [Brigantiaea leucoxantha]
MPFINDSARRRHFRHASTPQKPTSSQAPAVVLQPAPSDSRRTLSNASEAHLRPSRRQKEKPDAAPKEQELEEESSEPLAKSDSKKKGQGHVDVFAFMDNAEEDDDEEHEDNQSEEAVPLEPEQTMTATSSPISTGSHSRHYSDLEVNADQQAKRQTWHGSLDHGGSFHSDSGISMGSSNGAGDSPILLSKYPSIRRSSRTNGSREASIPEHYGLEASPDPIAPQLSATGADCWSQLNMPNDQQPEAYYVSVSGNSPQPLNENCFQLPVTPPELSPQLPRARKQAQRQPPSRKKEGYECLASNISAQGGTALKPTYRRFETLQNRYLLELQDEISELESNLEELDIAIAHEAHAMARGSRPASRRSEAKMPTQSQWRRMDLLGRCAQKLDVYNRALANYASTQTLSPASSVDIAAYRKWIAKHNPIAEPETLFLKHRKDLLTIGQASKLSNLSGSLEYSPITIALTLLTTIIVFRFVPQFMARVVMSAVIGIALICVVTPDCLSDLGALREQKRGIGV